MSKSVSTSILENVNRKLNEGEIIDGIDIFDVVEEAWEENMPSQEILPASFIARMIAYKVQDEDKIDVDVFNSLVEDVYNFASTKAVEIEDYLSQKLKEVNNCRANK